MALGTILAAYLWQCGDRDYSQTGSFVISVCFSVGTVMVILGISVKVGICHHFSVLAQLLGFAILTDTTAMINSVTSTTC